MEGRVKGVDIPPFFVVDEESQQRFPSVTGISWTVLRTIQVHHARFGEDKDSNPPLGPVTPYGLRDLGEPRTQRVTLDDLKSLVLYGRD